jgi:hypothetical protein
MVLPQISANGLLGKRVEASLTGIMIKISFDIFFKKLYEPKLIAALLKWLKKDCYKFVAFLTLANLMRRLFSAENFFPYKISVSI